MQIKKNRGSYVYSFEEFVKFEKQDNLSRSKISNAQ